MKRLKCVLVHWKKYFLMNLRYGYGMVLYAKLRVSNLIWHFIAKLRITQLDLIHLIMTRIHLPVWKRMLLDVKLYWFKDLS